MLFRSAGGFCLDSDHGEDGDRWGDARCRILDAGFGEARIDFGVRWQSAASTPLLKPDGKRKRPVTNGLVHGFHTSGPIGVRARFEARLIRLVPSAATKTKTRSSAPFAFFLLTFALGAAAPCGPGFRVAAAGRMRITPSLKEFVAKLGARDGRMRTPDGEKNCPGFWYSHVRPNRSAWLI